MLPTLCSMQEPTTLQAGDTISWTVALPAYPRSAGWSLKYRLINAEHAIDIASQPDPDNADQHLVQIDAATSKSYNAGLYTCVRYVERGTDRYTLDKSEKRILPDLTEAAPTDARSDARRALDDLRAALRRWLSSQGAVAEYEIAGRRMRFASAEDILKRIQLAEAEVAREVMDERAAAGLSPRRRLLVRFAR